MALAAHCKEHYLVINPLTMTLHNQISAAKTPQLAEFNKNPCQDHYPRTQQKKIDEIIRPDPQ